MLILFNCIILSSTITKHEGISLATSSLIRSTLHTPNILTDCIQGLRQEGTVCDSLKVHFSVNAKWQFVYNVRFAPSLSNYGLMGREYLYLNSPILMPGACDCLKNVHCMSAIYLLHSLISQLPCLQLGNFLFHFYFLFSSIFFHLFIYLVASSCGGLPNKLSRCQSVKCCSLAGYTFCSEGATIWPPYQYPFT